MALDKFSPGVQQFKKYLEGLIETKRTALERPSVGEAQTAHIRGYIKAARDILAHLNGDPDEDDQDSSS